MSSTTGGGVDHPKKIFCKSCKQVIIGVYFTYGPHIYHRECLKCEKCRTNLLEGGVCPIAGRLYCALCFRQETGAPCPPCHVCQKPLAGAGVKLGEMHFHTDCFRCVECKNQIQGKEFVFEDNKVLCPACNLKLKLELVNKMQKK